MRSLVLASLVCLCTGCSLFGIARREPMAPAVRETLSLAPGADLTAVVQQAAVRCHWTTQTPVPGVVRCTLTARGWSMTVDVRVSGNGYTIEYVDSQGLFYEPETQRIHPGYNKRVAQLRMQIQKLAFRPPPASVAVRAGAPAVAPSAAPAPAKPYRIVTFAREKGSDFAYRFELALTDAKDADLALSRRIKEDLRESVRAEYAAAMGMTDTRSLRIEFPDYAVRNGGVTGRVVVLSVRLLEFTYEPALRHGRLAVKVDPRHYEVTRQWVRNNIATLARDKDASFAGRFSGTPKFAIGREVLRDDNVLEVEFTVGGEQP